MGRYTKPLQQRLTWNEPPPTDLSYVWAHDPWALHAMYPDRFPDPETAPLFASPESDRVLLQQVKGMELG